MNVEIDMSDLIRLNKDLVVLEDKIVQNTARFTLDFTNSKGAFPYLTGTLQRSSMALGVKGSNMEYALGSGVDYGVAVYSMGRGIKWTNPSTVPQWYINIFKNNKEIIISNAISSSMKGL